MVEQSIVLVVAFLVSFVRMLGQSEEEERRVSGSRMWQPPDAPLLATGWGGWTISGGTHAGAVG
jgi:hypothetical protein